MGKQGIGRDLRRAGRIRRRPAHARWLAAACLATCVTIAPTMVRAQSAPPLIIFRSLPIGIPAPLHPPYELTVEVRGCDVVSVTGQLEGRSFALSGGDPFCTTFWSAGMPLDGPARRVTVTVTATTASGVQGTASASFLYDPPPLIAVDSPRAGDIADPTIDVVASCSDPDTCTRLFVYFSPWYPPLPPPQQQTLASGVDALSVTVDLSIFPEGSGYLVFHAEDALGAFDELAVPVQISAPPIADAGGDAGPSSDAGPASDAGPSDAGAIDGGQTSVDAGRACVHDGSSWFECKPRDGWHGWPTRWYGRAVNCSVATPGSGSALGAWLLALGLALLLRARWR